MSDNYSFLEKISRFFAIKKFRYMAMSLLLALALFYLMKGCSLDNHSERVYHIGQNPEWPKLHLMGRERNLTAFNNELLSTVAKEEHFRLHIVASSDPLTEVEQGKLEGVLSCLEASYLNENRLIFSDPYFLVGPVLIIPSTAPVEGWNEKGKKIIGIQVNSHSLLSLEQDPNIQIKTYDNIVDALSDLRARRIDGAIFPALPAYTYISTFYRDELKIATLPLTDEGIRLVAKNDETGKTLIKHFNQGLANLKKNGAYDKMLERWGFLNVEQVKP